MKYYIYKMTVDNGGAPCVDDDILSLAICKPAIRSTAQPGDLVFGFGGKDIKGRLIYIARITAKKENGVYYREAKYAGRSDCIYEWRDNALVWKTGSKYHKDGKEARKDVGAPPGFKKAKVLLSKDFRYLGCKGETPNPDKYPDLSELLAGLRKGHRANLSNVVQDEIKQLKNEIRKLHKKKVIGAPTQKELSLCCYDDEGYCRSKEIVP